MSVATVSAELLSAAKNYLDITWDDAAADQKLTGQLQRGIAYISAKTGVEEDAFSDNLRAQELLFNYVLYDRSGSLDAFKKAYKPDLVGLRLLWEVDQDEASAEG